MLRQRKKAQTSIEYVVLLVILMGAFLGIQNYLKRGLQGRWKLSVDELGDQYDPRTTNGSVRHVIMANSTTDIFVMNEAGGFWTQRTDDGVTLERKTGTVTVGGY